MRSIIRNALRLLLVSFTLHASAFTQRCAAQRPPDQPDAARILHEMQKLNVLGSVLYIAAHPDDENTRLIAWLANGKKVRTGYLSLTRGEGGQNLLGPELGDPLGIIRTQELLEARRIDGGEQFFTRATDFGFSKNAKECFAKWGHDEVLSDVVRVIRTFRPDIIITRFPPTREAGHGAHEASAILAAEAFKLAGDAKAFPEQLQQGLHVWKPRRLFFNGSTWWKADLAEIAKPDSGWYQVDVGGYDPLLGLSYTEIAGRSRSMHKSQGFGAAETRGELIEYLKFVDGDKPSGTDIFEGIDMSWERVPTGQEVGQQVSTLINSYNMNAPEQSEAVLTQLWRTLTMRDKTVDPQGWLDQKTTKVNALMEWCSGISLEATATDKWRSTADSVRFTMRTTLRRPLDMELLDPTGTGAHAPLAVNLTKENARVQHAPFSIDQPFWLAIPHKNLYEVPGPHAIGPPVLEQNLVADWPLRIRKDPSGFTAQRPLQYKWIDRVAGERVRPVYVTPVASLTSKTNVLIARGGPQRMEVDVRALTDSLTGQLELSLPEGWMTTKDLKLVNIPKRDGHQTLTVQLVPSEKAKAGVVEFKFTGPKGKADRTLHEIDYPHILPQVYYTPAEVKLVPLDVKCTAKTVGYIKGAGDDVPQAIEQLGVKVEMIDAATATLESLQQFDAIVTGIRAYNTNKALKDLNPLLMRYVENGGTLVCQYNTLSSDMVLPDSLFGPYPFKLTRDRVTVEEAPATFLAPTHALLNTPNRITAAGFEGWVQERGLYFCGGLDKHYTPLIAWSDPGEPALNGGIITCDYGKGRYVYTGISFFRELPAGVPGAYRLFANLISKRAE